MKMAYVSPNVKTKKELKERLAAGKGVDVYQPGIGNIPHDGPVWLEGPHYPEPHRWYAEGRMENGRLVKVR
jgi:hypothetical protein